MSIYATLHTQPAHRPSHEMLYITRGASATLHFNLVEQPYSFTDIDQLTFLLKQDTLLYWYRMFTYLVKSTDLQVIPNKTYFTNVELVNPASGSLQCKGTLVKEPTGNPFKQGYFEVVEGNYGWRDTWYLVDPQFTHSLGESYDYITLVLASEDTKHFEPTLTHGAVDFEIVVRLNTDSLTNLANIDSTIIEPQHPIAVVDSLYSKI